MARGPFGSPKFNHASGIHRCNWKYAPGIGTFAVIFQPCWMDGPWKLPNFPTKMITFFWNSECIPRGPFFVKQKIQTFPAFYQKALPFLLGIREENQQKSSSFEFSMIWTGLSRYGLGYVTHWLRLPWESSRVGRAMPMGGLLCLGGIDGWWSSSVAGQRISMARLALKIPGEHPNQLRVGWW